MFTFYYDRNKHSENRATLGIHKLVEGLKYIFVCTLFDLGFSQKKRFFFPKSKIVLLRGIRTFSTNLESYYFGDRTMWGRTKRGSPVLYESTILGQLLST